MQVPSPGDWQKTRLENHDSSTERRAMKRALRSGGVECSTVEPLWTSRAKRALRPRLEPHSATLNDHSYIGTHLHFPPPDDTKEVFFNRSLEGPVSLILLDLSTIPQVSLSCNQTRSRRRQQKLLTLGHLRPRFFFGHSALTLYLLLIFYRTCHLSIPKSPKLLLPNSFFAHIFTTPTGSTNKRNRY